MKTTFLPEVDLARIALLPFDEKCKRLEQLEEFNPRNNYNPLRNHTAEIFDIQHPSAELRPNRASWKQVHAEILGQCRSETEEGMNIEPARLLYDFAVAAHVAGQHYELPPLHIGADHKFKIRPQAILAWDQQRALVFVDPRRPASALTANGRLFVFSVLQHRLSSLGHQGVRPCVLQFDGSSGHKRELRVHFPDGMNLLGLKDIGAAVEETYAIWKRVRRPKNKSPKQQMDLNF